MEIKFHQKFKKNFKKRIQPQHKLVEAFENRLSTFLQNQKHYLLRDHKLVGKFRDYRAFSITGDIRLVYKITDDTLFLYDIGTHNQVY